MTRIGNFVITRHHPLTGIDVSDDRHSLAGFSLSGDAADALARFAEIEKDARLGRWRWPSNPDFVVYPPSESHKVTVFRESTGEQYLYARTSPTFADPVAKLSEWPAAALAYFEAHPEPPKPWHDAKYGEVWVVRAKSEWSDEVIETVRSVTTTFRFMDVNARHAAIDITSPLIVTAERIYSKAGA
ncbi:MAG: hypothetical protein IJO71_09445 [Microbacterium sp.]|uniref:hypothetical protein n=1 Tax=Microbacterium sp. TaxID=51671 RepID=UPI0025E3A022|nr:hypothetical protein [Microbacterium sp.]MBQ9917405.1 hypothetical protein [Microbacterium sp.]